MIEWLRTLEVHDFTGVRAAEQWESQEMSRKRKTQNADEGSEPKKLTVES